MINEVIYKKVRDLFKTHFGKSHKTAAYAPGRIEVLGNHTDYNEGFVFSAAIDMGTFFLVSRAEDDLCRVVAADLAEEEMFPIEAPSPSDVRPWSNFIKGVFSKLLEKKQVKHGFKAMFLGNIPLGAGLSSSAALEIATGLALSSLYKIDVSGVELARIGQAAEHDFVGARCGLMDQLSSLNGKRNALILADFRSLRVQNVPLGKNACFLMCDTGVKHSLVDSEYNERRSRCEQATKFFAAELDHSVTALRDVAWEDWEKHSPNMDPATARRAAHVIGENMRVLQGSVLLENGELDAFGKLMFDSHDSSIKNFENSCPELDFLVETARQTDGALGARLSGGGFGGSAVVLVHPRDAKAVEGALTSAYEEKFGAPCETRIIAPSDGASTLA